MGKKKDDEEKKRAKLLKKEKKLAKATRKELSREGIKEDIHQLLEKYENKPSNNVEQGKFVTCEQPSPRAMASLTCLPSGEQFMFGGEFYDGASVIVYNETYKWNIDRREWKRFEGPLLPKPRCSHQAVFYNDFVFIFGGEFSTTNQFYHFRDLWRFSLKANRWEEVRCSGLGPSARSGHRMVVYKNQLVVFGGFHDTFRETRYFNDLHVLCLQQLKWTRITFPSNAHIPQPRSGMIMVPFLSGNGIYVIGGYCKVKETQKGAKGKCFNDAWWLDMNQLQTSLKSKSVAPGVWVKLERKAAIPFIRSGMTAVTHKHLALCFGGVTDEDNGGTSMKSVFYNDIQAFDMARRRWFTIDLKSHRKGVSPGKVKKKVQSVESCAQENATGLRKCVDTGGEEIDSDNTLDSDHEEDDEDTFFFYIDVDGKLLRVKMEGAKKEAETPSGDAQNNTNDLCLENSHLCETLLMKANDESISASKKSSPAKETNTSGKLLLVEDFTRPLPRFSPMLTVKNNDFIVYGGLIELRDAELTLDDCWSFNLNNRTQWTCLLSGHLDDHPWNEKEDTDEDSESCSHTTVSELDVSEESMLDDSEFSDTPTSDEDSVDSLTENGHDASPPPRHKKKSNNGPRTKLFRENIFKIQDKLNSLPHKNSLPEANESLSSFLKRSKMYWLNVVVSNQIECHGDEKALRREAFLMASEHYEKTIDLVKKLSRLENAQQEKELMKS